MGVYRLLLATLVVLFHFGGWSPLTGRTAVFGFYCLSGYLMTMVNDRVYSDQTYGALKFYANRALRIYPLYIFYVAATVIAATTRGSVAFVIDTGEPTFSLINSHILHLGANGWLHELVFGNTESRSPVNAGIPYAIPQAWSLGVEMMFYLVAPAISFLRLSVARWGALLLIWLGYVIWTIEADKSLDSWRYQSFAGSAIAFLFGAALFRFRGQLPRIPHPGAIAVVGIAAWIETIRHVTAEATDTRFYSVLALQFAITFAIVQVRPAGWWARIDRFCGNISYGVFVAHFFAALLLLSLADRMRSTVNPYPLGRINQQTFGLYAVALTVVCAVLTYFALEHPLERVRDRVRGSSQAERLTPTSLAAP